MEPRGDTPEGNPKKTPKIVKIGRNWRSIARNVGEKTHSDNEEVEVFEEFSIDSTNWLFEKNQNSEIQYHPEDIAKP